MNNNKIAFTFASSEVNPLGRLFIQATEFATGKLTLRKLYNQYLNENRPPENFWHDALNKLQLNIISSYQSEKSIPEKGSLIVVANHAFGVVDGLTMCSLITNIRQDYKILTHKVLRQADAVKDKILPIDFAQNKEALKINIESRKEAEKVLLEQGVIIIFPSGMVATKDKLKKNTKAIDGEWKQFTSKLAIKTKSPVLPMYFEGSNSQLFHIANKIGQTFRYSLMMHEVKRKIGDNIKVHIGNLIPYEKIKDIGDLKEITKFLREQTYSLDPEKNNN